MEFKAFPKNTENDVIKIDIINKINLLKKNIFVFLIPYVRPIPKESILIEVARNI